jgi:NhaP-type Na+/H+ or K+/H+ antiporter
MSEHLIFSVSAIVIVCMIMLYMFLGLLIERSKVPFGHEASLVVIFGGLIAYLASHNSYTHFNDKVSFDSNLFFYFCLPPIVLASGFNMKRKIFFENFGAVLIFGVFSTILQFFLFSFGLWFINGMGVFTKFNLTTGIDGVSFELSMMEILLMCSLICSSDVVAAIAVVKYEQQPKLFSVIFGEGITNDAVGIILFNTVMEYAGPHSIFTGLTPVQILGSFLYLCIFSVIVGAVVGYISAFAFKKFRILTHNTIIECALVFCFGYISYVLAELIELSGIVSLLACGIFMGQFTWYNLSPQGK